MSVMTNFLGYKNKENVDAHVVITATATNRYFVISDFISGSLMNFKSILAIQKVILYAGKKAIVFAYQFCEIMYFVCDSFFGE